MKRIEFKKQVKKRCANCNGEGYVGEYACPWCKGAQLVRWDNLQSGDVVNGPNGIAMLGDYISSSGDCGFPYWELTLRNGKHDAWPSEDLEVTGLNWRDMPEHYFDCPVLLRRSKQW